MFISDFDEPLRILALSGDDCLRRVQTLMQSMGSARSRSAAKT